MPRKDKQAYNEYMLDYMRKQRKREKKLRELAKNNIFAFTFLQLTRAEKEIPAIARYLGIDLEKLKKAKKRKKERR